MSKSKEAELEFACVGGCHLGLQMAGTASGAGTYMSVQRKVYLCFAKHKLIKVGLKYIHLKYIYQSSCVLV